MKQFKILINEYLRSWKQHFGVQLSTMVVLTATFAVIFSIFSVIGNLNQILTSWGKDVQVTVFLEEELNREAISQIEAAITKVEGFQTVRYVSKDEARSRFLKQVPGFAKDIVEDPEFANPFPASFQMGGLPSNLFSKLPEFAKDISKLEGVEDVSYGQDWVQNYAGFVKSISRSGLFIVLTLALGSLFVIGNSIRVALSQRREEIEILELVGATTSMIRTPYVFEGAMTGGLASLFALIISFAIYRLEVSVIKTEMSFLGISDGFSFLSTLSMFVMILFGIGAGAFGAYVCVSRINTGWAAGQKASRDR